MPDSSSTPFAAEKRSMDVDSVETKDRGERVTPKWARGSVGIFTRVWTTVAPVLVFLLPSFIPAWFQRNRRPPPPPPGPTAFLDGLRGVAALIVYLCHYTTKWTNFNDYGYGFGGPQLGNYSFIQLPFVRLIIAGSSSVAVFFAISGYALSIRPLTLIHKGQHEKVYDSLASAVFRRWLRLYLPILTFTAMLGVAVHIPLGWTNSLAGSGIPFRAPDMITQFQYWWRTSLEFTNPWRDCGNSRAHQCVGAPVPPLWTIPVEMLGSIYVFLFLLAFAKMKRWVHAAVLCAISWWLTTTGEIDMVLFFFGMLLAELTIVVPTATFPERLSAALQRVRVPPRAAHLAHHAVSTVTFVLALYLLSYPAIGGEVTPGWISISRLAPMWYWRNLAIRGVQYYWLTLGAMVLMVALSYGAPLRMPRAVSLGKPTKGAEGDDDTAYTQPLFQRIFTTRLARYLGFISFSMYLCHDPILMAVGTRYSNPGYTLWAGYVGIAPSLTGELKATYLAQWRREYYWLVIKGYFVCTFWVIWISDILTRAVDIPCVSLTKKLSNWATKKEQ